MKSNSKEMRRAIGSYLRKAREDRELTQNGAAKRLQMGSGQYVSNFERGVCLPPIRKLRKLARIYGLQSEVLIDDYCKARVAQYREMAK